MTHQIKSKVFPVLHITSALILIGVLSACVPGQHDDKDSNPNLNAAFEKNIHNKAPEFTIDASKLSEEFRASANDAEAKYDGNVIVITGMADSTATQQAKDSSFYKVALIPNVICYFASPHAVQIAALKLGYPVTIKGKCKGKADDSNVILQGCSFQ